MSYTFNRDKAGETREGWVKEKRKGQLEGWEGPNFNTEEVGNIGGIWSHINLGTLALVNPGTTDGPRNRETRFFRCGVYFSKSVNSGFRGT